MEAHLAREENNFHAWRQTIDESSEEGRIDGLVVDAMVAENMFLQHGQDRFKDHSERQTGEHRSVCSASVATFSLVDPFI
jgi:hypothetical protein